MMNKYIHISGGLSHQFFLCILLLVLGMAASGQYSSNSLYSLYGIGDLVPSSFAKQSGLGRAGVALSSEGFINTLNSASLTGFGKNDVIVDIGFSGYYARFESRGDNNTATDINLDHFAMGVPITKWWGASLGIIPFSSVGYDILTTSVYEGSTSEIETEFIGSGGINQLFFSNSFRLIKNLSLGVNISYLWGSVKQTEITNLLSVGYDDVNTEDSYYLRNLYMGFGLLYNLKFNNDNLSFGISYYPRQNLVANYSHKIILTGDQEISLINESESEKKFNLPGSIKAGLAYNFNSKLKIIGDYGIQQWSGNSSLIKTVSFTEKFSYNFGLEYTPNPDLLTNFLHKVEYRLGAYYENNYILVRENQIKDCGITIGVGVPLRDQKSKINFSLELGQLGLLHDGLVRERYAGFSLDIALYQKWFMRKKFD